MDRQRRDKGAHRWPARTDEGVVGFHFGSFGVHSELSGQEAKREPTEPGMMRRPPRPVDEPLLSRFLLWRIVFVSSSSGTGSSACSSGPLLQGANVEAARTVAINTLVCMEVFHLFSVRYLKVSFTLQGLRDTPLVLTAVAGVFALQLLFTYAPPMQSLFRTEALPLTWGAAIVAVGVVLLLVLECEKTLLRRFGALK
jgi:magnesium-transporting ATPase (P-type)